MPGRAAANVACVAVSGGLAVVGGGAFARGFRKGQNFPKSAVALVGLVVGDLCLAGKSLGANAELGFDCGEFSPVLVNADVCSVLVESLVFVFLGTFGNALDFFEPNPECAAVQAGVLHYGFLFAVDTGGVQVGNRFYHGGGVKIAAARKGDYFVIATVAGRRTVIPVARGTVPVVTGGFPVT